jgi:ketosteroid isomerase-like protein
MSSTGRFSMVAIVGIVTILSVGEGTALTKFASDDVAAAARVPGAAEALAARSALDEAFAAQDADAVAALCAKDLIVNTPANRVARLEQVLGFFRAGRMNYESVDVTIEAVDARKEQVVLMGEEVVKPRDAAANAGKTVTRRFTDVWQKEADGKWRLTIRHATITAVD